ncbi:hypothetical protein [Apilactobacillus timberlakei]|uniref:hypothetical protein n=1 Tax=Apilactobacillus timberlakei TaxID=2008380 RepID=UPI00112C1E77|nr:hypothetical protein [Apilactobacillus timberlakei]TPR16767.1 hypothetical protein DYZ95_07235 [Apilactobacillus timberlakei]TPR21530.1 hypothetical protein DY083_05785 [Apilactobacillus timberlakei]
MSKLNASIMSYKNRGKWGDYSYRGNCSGHVINDLLDTFKPNRFVEVFSGGGTGRDVARDKGYKGIHLDLNNGWDALSDEIPVASDFIFSHPPYWDIIKYKDMRNNQYDANDLSNKMNYEEFIQKLDKVNKKIYDALIVGGRHAFLIGDVRKSKKYYSIIKDMTWFGELEEHLIKEQFNTVSAKKSYGGSFIPISHEHLLIFKKTGIWNMPIKFTKNFDKDIRELDQITWKALIQGAIEELNGTAKLSELYATLQDSKKAQKNEHWKEKIRQIVRDSTVFLRVDVGTYQLQ